ncbi:MAG: hypothetical protein ABEL76_14150 [Bradymonadaceae bacterium]
MSDDRFKKARQSLMDEDEEEEGQEGTGGGAGDSDDFGEAKTEMVDLDDLAVGDSEEAAEGGGQTERGDEMHREPRRGGEPSGEAAGGGDPGGDSLKIGEGGGGDGGGDGGDDGKTAMVDMEQLHEEGGDLPDPGDVQMPGADETGGAEQAGGGGEEKMRIPGGEEDAGADEKTAFVDLDQFADQEPDPDAGGSGQQTFAPDEGTAGHEGSTQFVDVDSLVGSEGASEPGAAAAQEILDDQTLNQAYQFDSQSIDQGDITLIYAQNSLGNDVILRQIWQGSGAGMPTDLRERVNQLDALEVPQLLDMSGMVITDTGCWVELERPSGTRLSDILQRQGAQSRERVVGWATQIAETLEQIHAADLVYANLTPDAVWIDGNDGVTLESFDLISLEDRGDLGRYGPPEMQAHPENRQLYPSTDVYSLAAVTLAGLTGVPVELNRLQALEDSGLQTPLQQALHDDPHERTQTARDFADQLSGGGSLFGDPDIKVVGAAAFALLAAGAGGWYYYKKRQRRKRRRAAAAAQKTAKKKAAAKKKKKKKRTGGQPSGKQPGSGSGKAKAKAAGSAQGGSAGSGSEAVPPGAVKSDPRLKIVTSFRKRPPSDAESTGSEMPADARKKKIDKLEKRARKALEKAGDLSDDRAKAKYRSGLAAVTQAIELKQGDAGELKSLRDKILSRELATKYYNGMVEKVHDNLATGAMGEAQIAYQSYAKYAPGANAAKFFVKAGQAGVVKHGTSPKDEEEKDE